jgi:carboxypeptidase C (cathepsin A)
MNATILFVDSPVGTGFSYLQNPAGYVTSEKYERREKMNSSKTLKMQANGG